MQCIKYSICCPILGGGGVGALARVEVSTLGYPHQHLAEGEYLGWGGGVGSLGYPLSGPGWAGWGGGRYLGVPPPPTGPGWEVGTLA